jgi:uncharacterized membrane protein YjfL (UPF0719 family)
MGQLVVSVAQVILAVIMGVIAAYLGIVLFNRATRHVDEWAEIRRGNAAMGMVLGSIIVGIALILRPALVVAPPADTGAQLYPVYALLVQAAGLLVGLVLALAAIVLAVALFSRLTGQIDELAELQQGNMAVAAMLVGVVLSVSVLMAGAIGQIMQWFMSLMTFV